MVLGHTLRSFVFYAEHMAGLPRGLATAVIRQHGNWKSFKECAPDFAQHGVDGGFSGFIYYNETVEFAKKYRNLIAKLAESQSEDFGSDVIDMIKGFNCFKDDRPSTSVIGRCLYGDSDDSSVMNALAWYAAEEVLRAYVDFTESQGGDDE